jgi:hypothetical protein
MASVIGYFFAILLAYGIPGWLALTFADSRLPHRKLLAIPVGLALWGWQGWIFGLLGVRWMTYGYLALCCAGLLLFVFRYFRTKHAKKNPPTPIDALSLGIIIIGTLIQATIIWRGMVPAGMSYTSCCGDGNDNVWYAAVARSLTASVPADTPGLAGVPLHNYHFWSNLVVADMVRIFHLSQMPFQFPFSGIVLSFLLGMTVWIFSTVVSSNVQFRRWLLFFTYFGADALYLISLVVFHRLALPASSLEDGARFLSNLPRSYAVVIAFAWFTLWFRWRDRLRIPRIILLASIASAIIGFKVYVALFILCGLVADAGISFVRRRPVPYALLFLTGILSSLVYLPVNSGAGGLYFTGFWRFEDFIVQPGFGLSQYELARRIFAADHKWAKAIVFDIFFGAIYVITTFGTKCLGLFQSGGSKRLLPAPVHYFFLPSLLVSFVLGLFFQQTTGGSNSFNFLVNVFVFGGLYTAAVCAASVSGTRNRAVRWLLTMSIIALTLPRTFGVLDQTRTLNRNPWSIADQSAASVYAWAKAHTPNGARFGIIPYTQVGESVPLLLSRPVYLSAPSFLSQFGIDTKGREVVMDTIATSTDSAAVREALALSGIEYLMISTASYSAMKALLPFTTPLYQTDLFTVTAVNKEGKK